MDEENQSQDQCRLNLENGTGKTNLCCCYAMDSDGNYEEPCYTPLDDCC